MNPLELSRADIVELFTELGARLHARGVHGDVYLVGGAAIALQLDTRRSTRDVDAVFAPPGDVREVAGEIAAERGLPTGWLNSSAAAFLPERERVGPVLLDVPGLSVAVAPAEHLLAMKLAAGRPGRDLDDIATLLDHLGIDDPADAARLARRMYGEESVVLSDPDESYALLAEDALRLLARRRHGSGG
jgi:hypothetical protein